MPIGGYRGAGGTAR